MSDPTYNMDEINKNPIWKLAFKLSELENDNAPLGWGKYIPRAKKQIAKNKTDQAHD